MTLSELIANNPIFNSLRKADVENLTEVAIHINRTEFKIANQGMLKKIAKQG